IVTWSDHFTDFAGSISVRGGENGGDGGFTEVSAKQDLRYLGQADGRAPQGETGTLLLDPTDIVVDAAAASAIETTLLTINAILDTDSEGSDLGNITVNAPISWATTNTLQLIADNNILINAAITGSSGGTLDATADGDITTSAGGVLDVSTIDLTSDGSVTIGANVTSDDFDIFSDGALLVNGALNGGIIDIEANGSVTFNDDVTASSIFFDVSGLITTGAGGAFSTGVFTLFGGNWVQSAATLPAFSSTDFRLSSGGGSGPDASFLRVLGGDGMPGSPYQLTDVYGLQGINTGGFSTADFDLANDIDASATRTWNFFGEGDPSGFDPIEGYSGTFNGGRFTIDGLLIERFASGLFGTLSGTVTDLRMTNADINTGSGGILAVTNSGLIRNTSVGGTVDAFTGAAGGMVGTNTSVIDDSFSTATVSMTTFSDDTLSVGGLAGVNTGTISRSHATGLVSGTETGSGPFFQMGGLVGSNQGTIRDSYAMGDVQASLVSGSAFIGGLAGINSSALTILNSYSTGAPSATGTGSATLGGLTPDTIGLVTGSFWDIETSGIATSPGGGTGLTTEQMTNIDLFFPLANAAGWDFESVWASGARGDYARNLSTSPVLSVFPLPLTVQYGLTDSAVSNGNAFGGPGGLYVFGPLGDSLDLSVLGSPNEFADINAGTTTYRPSTTTLTSSMGQSFDARSITAVATITPAPLTVTADNQAKTEGDTLTFTGTELTASGLFFSDSVTSGVLSSTGAAADAAASATPYPIVFDEEAGLTGTGLSNYTITYQNGELLVVAAPEPPLPETITPVIDPPVTVDTEFEEDGGGGGGTAVNPVDAALATTGTVEELSSDVEEKIAACGKQDQDVSQYLACLADAMDTYAEDLEAIADSLPPGLEDIGDIIRDAVAGVRAAGENAERRLALATTPAERAAIRREALQQARASIRGAQAEIRKAITLIRAEDPELAGLQRVQVETIVAAVGQAEIGLSRVLEL
ncbi:MAG: MBG domain-containing protein, partial [Pseudomonadota bacterium]